MSEISTMGDLTESFLLQRVQQLLTQHYLEPNNLSRVPHIKCRGTMKRATQGTPESRLKERLMRSEEICRGYHLVALDPDHHIEKLDEAVSKLVWCGFPQYKPNFLHNYASQTEERLVRHACNLLPVCLVSLFHLWTFSDCILKEVSR
jgi:hypothetical protein